MSIRAETISTSPGPTAAANSPWLYRPWLDLLVGCGAWSAPLLAIATWMTPSHQYGWTVAFYALAIVFNYPHFMATVYRAYHTRENFEKYKILTLHVTLLIVLTGVLLHAWPRLLPWVFTLYICWSPWHYTGQNYGLLMMFARRSGATVAVAERRWIRAAFIASYLMLLASFETGASGESLVLSLGLLAKFTLWARVALGLAFGLFVFLGFRRLAAKCGWDALAAPILLAFTQFLWFVLPTFLELRNTYHLPQTQYSSGILAVLHSAQYLWVTSYYQQREARASGAPKWGMAGYFVTLIAGGIALFIPGPWLVSYILKFDFTTSLLIFTALVNIHHFILDGAVWKLRDKRVSSLLIDKNAETAAVGSEGVAARSFARRLFAAPAFRITVVGVLLLWGIAEEVRYALGTDEGNLSALVHSSRMNPYDSSVEARIAVAEGKAGKRDDAIAALKRAVAINPENIGLQHATAKAMLQDGRYQEAFDHYAKMLKLFPRDPDALVNYGLLAAKLGNPQAAMDSWQKAETVDPDQPNPHLYLAQGFDRQNQPASAARQWQEYLRTAALHPDDPAAGTRQQASAMIQLADDENQINRPDLAGPQYKDAIELADRAGDFKLESLGLAHLGDLYDRAGEGKSAAQLYQRGLAADAKAGDPRGEAVDWFNYAQFLRRHGQKDALVDACLVHAENLLSAGEGPELTAIRTARQEIESRLNRGEQPTASNLPNLLATAQNLPTTSF